VCFFGRFGFFAGFRRRFGGFFRLLPFERCSFFRPFRGRRTRGRRRL
jgi:hypothetical protein